MGRKFDAYDQAAQAEQMAKDAFAANNTEETYENAQQAEQISNVVFREFLDDPQG